MKEEKITNNEVMDNTPSDPKTLPESKPDNNASSVEIKETATIKSEVGTSVIGKINGEKIVPTNNPLPDKIDITIKQTVNRKTNNKKIKIITKREKIMNIISFIIVLLVLVGGGFSLYYFGYLNNPSNFKTKNLSFEVGSTLPNSASYYITSPINIDDMEYNIDLSNINVSLIGNYTYSVNHKGVIKNGTVTIKDSVGPVVTLKTNLNFVINSTINKDDVVESCTDISNCTYDFESKVNTTAAGTITTNIIAKDDVGNTTTTPVTINIIDISKTLTCTSSETLSNDKTYKTVIEDTLNFDSKDILVSSSSKKIVYYIDYASYFQLLNDQKDNTAYTFDKKTFSYSMKNDSISTTLKNFNEINEYYKNNSYTCQ